MHTINNLTLQIVILLRRSMSLLKMFIALSIVAALTMGTLGVSESSAQPRPNVFDGGNLWQITAFDDSSPEHTEWATQEICFLPYIADATGIHGMWYSLSFPDWNGRYRQEGDEVKMTGDYAKDIGHDHMTLYHTTWDSRKRTRGMAFKDWTEWREDGASGRIIGWCNARMTRVGFHKYPKGEGIELEKRVLKLSQNIPPRLRRDSKEKAQSPLDGLQESLATYNKRIGKK